jgi:bifunctional non-homologous end joining protein LigD
MMSLQTRSSFVSKIKAENHLIEITNEDRVLFPQSGITKGDLIKYYEKIAPTMLFYMKDRLISMQRFPNGIDQEGFYQKDASEYFPKWIKRVAVNKQDGGRVNYVVCNNAATLIYLANQACITNHIWLSRIDKLKIPDRMIFDLDPSDCSFTQIRNAALIVKKHLEDLDLCAFAMTTGSRGIHVVVPLKRKYSFDIVRQFAKNIAVMLVDKYPEKFTIEMHKQKRGKRIFIDFLRNAFGQTGVAPYSVRARENAPVATPLFWQEVSNPKLTPTKYTIKNIFKRLDEVGDPWEKIDKHACSIKR